MKYYTIEKYENYAGHMGPTSDYDVRTYASLDALKAALLKGAVHGGQLMAAQGLEFKVELFIGEEAAKGERK